MSRTKIAKKVDYSISIISAHISHQVRLYKAVDRFVKNIRKPLISLTGDIIYASKEFKASEKEATTELEKN